MQTSPDSFGQKGNYLLVVVPTGWCVVALDLTGCQCDTETLARHLGRWTDEAQNAALLVGDPDGLLVDVLEKVNEVWALPALTLASVVRVNRFTARSVLFTDYPITVVPGNL